MTFSEKHIVDLITKHFVPVWESVAPVSTATFDLGDGRTVKGTVGGEIAVFFCLPDGRAFDILPALQSPRATLDALNEALETFRHVREDPDARVKAHHLSRSTAGGLGLGVGLDRPPSKKRLEDRLRDEDAGNRALATMALSKTAGFAGTVIEPSGLSYYKQRIHALFAGQGPKTPGELRKAVFEDILEVKLVSRNEIFTSGSMPEPMMLIEDDE